MISLTQQWVFARMRLTLRNPRALVFTFAFPLILIVLFSALNGNAEVDAYGEKIRFAQFYTPAIAIFSLVTACYTTLDPRHRHRARPGAVQARAGHAAADGDLPRLVGDGRDADRDRRRRAAVLRVRAGVRGARSPLRRCPPRR